MKSNSINRVWKVIAVSAMLAVFITTGWAQSRPAGGGSKPQDDTRKSEDAKRDSRTPSQEQSGQVPQAPKGWICGTPWVSDPNRPRPFRAMVSKSTPMHRCETIGPHSHDWYGLECKKFFGPHEMPLEVFRWEQKHGRRGCIVK